MIQDLGTYKTWWLKNVKDFKAGSIYSIEIEYNTTVDIEVYLNNELLRRNIQYRWDSANNSVILSAGIG